MIRERKPEATLARTKLGVKRLLMAGTGIFLVCLGVAINNNTGLGNDPVGIVYDGIRAFFHISQIRLGFVSNFINVGLILLLLLIGRRYVNIGTFMYLIPYGFFITIGSHLYPLLFSGGSLVTRLIAATVGISLYYIGISLFVATDIGVDPFNGFMLTIRDKTGWSLRRSKVTFDFCLMTGGSLLGGRLGLITIVTALTTGPVIQFLTEKIQRYLLNQKG